MAITFAGIDFNYVVYDERADTLFLGVDGPSTECPEDTYDTPEGHFVELDARGSIVAIEMMNPRWLLERDGELRITLRERPTEACPGELVAALA